MATDTLKRFREEVLRLGSAARKRRQGELLEAIRADAVAVIALASETAAGSAKEKRLEQLLEEIRAAAEELRAATEAHIAAVLGLAEKAARVWWTMWEAALRVPSLDRATEAERLRLVLEETEQTLREALSQAQEHAQLFERPLARLDELEARAAEFPLWARECLARWEMLDRPAPPLDPERVARAQSAYERGEHEDLDDVLSRVEAGGPWVEE